jgi:AraC-like DNA-binding protein
MLRPFVRLEQLRFDDPLLHRVRIAEHFWGATSELAIPKGKPERWHYNQEAEIVLISQGYVDFFIDDDQFSLSPGDVVLIGPGQLHASRRRYHSERCQIVLHFDLRYCLDMFAAGYFSYFHGAAAPLSRFNSVIRSNPALNDRIFQAVMTIRREMEERKAGYDISVILQLKTILLELLRHDPESDRLLRTSALLAEIRPVIDYVNQHRNEKISLKKMSELSNMSYHYFSRFFKKTMGMSFLEYVNGLRIKEAERLLVTTSLSVSEIAGKVGIPNVAHFYEMFRKFNGCSPSEYKKRKLGWLRSGKG